VVHYGQVGRLAWFGRLVGLLYSSFLVSPLGRRGVGSLPCSTYLLFTSLSSPILFTSLVIIVGEGGNYLSPYSIYSYLIYRVNGESHSQ